MEGRRAIGLATTTLALVVTLVCAALAQPPVPPGSAAPEITAGRWINSAPLTIGGLRGRVVLVEFWTFG